MTMSDTAKGEEDEAEYGRCLLCNTPYETYTRQDGPNSWKIGKTCPNPECDHE
jgi:hypothetical protein